MYRRKTRTCLVSKGADGDKGGSGGAKSRLRGCMKARPPDLLGSLGGFRSVLVAAVLADRAKARLGQSLSAVQHTEGHLQLVGVGEWRTTSTRPSWNAELRLPGSEDDS